MKFQPKVSFELLVAMGAKDLAGFRFQMPISVDVNVIWTQMFFQSAIVLELFTTMDACCNATLGIKMFP